jgi:hypothetical protein
LGEQPLGRQHRLCPRAHAQELADDERLVADGAGRAQERQNGVRRAPRVAVLDGDRRVPPQQVEHHRGEARVRLEGFEHVRGEDDHAPAERAVLEFACQRDRVRSRREVAAHRLDHSRRVPHVRRYIDLLLPILLRGRFRPLGGQPVADQREQLGTVLPLRRMFPRRVQALPGPVRIGAIHFRPDGGEFALARAARPFQADEPPADPSN